MLTCDESLVTSDAISRIYPYTETTATRTLNTDPYVLAYLKVLQQHMKLYTQYTDSSVLDTFLTDWMEDYTCIAPNATHANNPLYVMPSSTFSTLYTYLGKTDRSPIAVELPAADVFFRKHHGHEEEDILAGDADEV